MDYIIIILSIISVCISAVCLVLLARSRSGGQIEELRAQNERQQQLLRKELSESVQSSVNSLGEIVTRGQKSASEAQSAVMAEMGKTLAEKQDALNKVVVALMQQLENRFKTFEAANEQKLDGMRDTIEKRLGYIQENNDGKLEIIRRTVDEKMTETGKTLAEKQDELNKVVVTMVEQLENRFKTFEASNEQKLENMRETVEKRLSYIQQDNNEKLESMRKTVDEKLQKTLEDKMTQSFRLVNERLEQVYKGLGEMQNLAVGVGDLKKVLSNVKTRGIMGEIQLDAILREILSPEQYDVNIATKPGSSERVEYAVKLPAEDNGHIYLPIDSKFPADAYADLQDAYESGSAEAVNKAFAALSARLRAFAKDIKTKYVAPPHTTEFAVMFLPFEGLYAEVVNRGLVEVLQREYRINIAGPSTMAALLNSLQMGFKTLAIQKRSGEVWQTLGAVKTEFDKFGDVISAAQQKINKANEDLDKLVGTRTRAIQRKLRDVEKLSEAQSAGILDSD